MDAKLRNFPEFQRLFHLQYIAVDLRCKSSQTMSKTAYDITLEGYILPGLLAFFFVPLKSLNSLIYR